MEAFLKTECKKCEKIPPPGLRRKVKVKGPLFEKKISGPGILYTRRALSAMNIGGSGVGTLLTKHMSLKLPRGEILDFYYKQATSIACRLYIRLVISFQVEYTTDFEIV